MNFMPAYLDSKANRLPAKIDSDYYGSSAVVVQQTKGTKNDTEKSLPLSASSVDMCGNIR
jgi:hypothetical protein